MMAAEEMHIYSLEKPKPPKYSIQGLNSVGRGELWDWITV